MLLPGENSPKTWLLVTILVSTLIGISESSGGKTLDIKIGFDLTQGSNGAPSLRIRDFEDSAEYNPRAVEEESSTEIVSKKKSSPRDSSESDERERRKKEESSKEPGKSSKSSNDSEDDDDENISSHKDKLRSTRGLKAVDFEPEEENPKIHGRYQKNSESENTDENRRRYRRHINDKFENSKG